MNFDEMPDDAGDSLRERKKRETRAAISAAATALFIERGFENVTVAEVAAAANVAKMTVFNYFSRKEDLFFDRAGEGEALVDEGLRRRKKGQSPLVALHEILLELIDSGHPLGKIDAGVDTFWTAVRKSPALRARAREMQSAMENHVATKLAAAVGAPDKDPLSLLAASLLVAAWRAAYRSALAQHVAGEKRTTVMAGYIALVDRGFGAVHKAMKGTPYA